MFMLQMNDMRASSVENLTGVARAETGEELQRLLDTEGVASYPDGPWNKSYRKGGPLEWYNPPFSLAAGIVNVGSADKWAANARTKFEEQIMVLPTAP